LPDKLAQLWYIPHVTEIIIGMARPDKPHKGAIDLKSLIYRNNLTYSRSYKIHSYIEEIFTLIAGVSSMLQGNLRYSAAGNDFFLPKLQMYAKQTILLIP
jgi:hypothetical protein